MDRRWCISGLVVALSAACVHGGQAARPDIAIADFEGKDYGEWKATGEAFGPGPARGTLGKQMRVSGFQGKGLVNSFYKGDGTTGTLTSPPFRIERKFINFLIGGGGFAGTTCMNLLVEGKAARTAAGPNLVPGGSERLDWQSWNVEKLLGKTAVIQIVDAHRGGWGHINADHIVQSDAPRSAPVADPEAERQRLQALSKPARERLADLGVKTIVFAARKVDGDGHWYANFSYWSNNPKRTLYHDGGRLCRLDVPSGEVTVLLDDPKGGVRDPQMHYDGRRILLSYRKGGQPFYHLYEINTDPSTALRAGGSGLRQLTDGPYDDIEPTYLPDGGSPPGGGELGSLPEAGKLRPPASGGIIFCSSRCNRMVNCYYVRVAVIYRCDADGGNIRQLSSNIEQDNTPWVLPDGRILHQRWEYIDRSQVGYHHLWTMNPDGTNQMIYYGNQNPSTVMIDAKPIPGTQKVVVSFSPGHGRKEHAGTITIVDPGAGPDARPNARAVSRGGDFRDPYALAEDCFLVASEQGILVMDGSGHTTVLYDLPAADKRAGLKLHEPRPMRPRPRERPMPVRTNLARTTGRVMLADVHTGRNMAGVQRSEIKKLLVLEALPKPVNFSGGWEPLTFGGSFTLERVLGTVPVEADGSAYFELPPLRSLFFVALDEHDMAVKRMQSFLTVQPGETFGCVGCHEQRTRAIPQPDNLLAMRRPPSSIEPVAGVPDVIDFPRDIQPILDRHCVACHGYDATKQGGPRSGGVILTGDRGAMYSHSYVTLTVRGQISDGRNLLKSNYPPRALGSSASRLMTKIGGSHSKVRVSDREKKLIRLWLDSAAAYPGTYAALGSGMVGGQGWGGDAKAVLARRCGACHKGNTRLPQQPGDNMGIGTTGTVNVNDRRHRFSNHLLFNLTRPDKSLVLLAPLAKAAGGYGTCKSDKQVDELTGKPKAVFATTADPDYKTLLRSMQAAKANLERAKRFDMPGFRPNEHYVREMKFYGVLPKDLAPNAPIDVYATDQAYWRSLWHRPQPHVNR